MEECGGNVGDVGGDWDGECVVMWEGWCVCGGVCVGMGCQSSGRVVVFGSVHCIGRGDRWRNVRIGC